MDETMLGGRYRRVRPLGRGAMGEVWLAEDTLLHRHVAVKSVSSYAPAESADLNRVIREARLAAQLNHPHAVSVYDVIVVDERPFVVMEYVPGQSLAERIATSPPETSEVGRIGIAVAEALGDAHLIGLVHRDIKPANIMITARGLPKIADFGIARLANDAERSTTGLTIGTPAYLSPELARGGTADPRSDIWALGVTLYAALDNGRSPFQQPDDNAFMVIARLAANPSPPEPRRGGSLTPTIMRMLAADPGRRPSADVVVEMLRGDLDAGRETRQWSLPPFAQSAGSAPALDGDLRPDRVALPPPPPVAAPRPPPMPPPPHPPPAETPREAFPLFGDESWDGDRSSGRYGAVRTASGRRRRRGVLVALVVLLVLAAGGAGVAVWLNAGSDDSATGGPSSPGGSSSVTTPSGGTSTSARPIGTVYTGPGGISVYAPANWRLDTSSGIANVRDYVAPPFADHNEATFFRIGIGNPSPKSSFDDQVQEEIDYLQGTTNTYKNVQLVGAPKRLTFLGAPAADFEYTGDYKNLKSSARGAHRHVLLRIWTDGGVQREIVLVAVASEWSMYQPVFTQLVSGAKVT